MYVRYDARLVVVRSNLDPHLQPMRSTALKHRAHQIVDKPEPFEIANRLDGSVIAVLGVIVQHLILISEFAMRRFAF
ncbi:unnamed protein product [Sphagnum balticum]